MLIAKHFLRVRGVQGRKSFFGGFLLIRGLAVSGQRLVELRVRQVDLDERIRMLIESQDADKWIADEKARIKVQIPGTP
jgi:hypothetical protein